MMNKEQIKDRCLKLFLQQKDVELAYLFGSQVTGRVNSRSDVDIAILFNQLISSSKYFRRRIELISLLGQKLGHDNIDLTVLNQAPILLAFNVIKDGNLIFSRNEIKRIEHEAKTMSFFYDQAYYLKRQTETNFSYMAKEGLS